MLSSHAEVNRSGKHLSVNLFTGDAVRVALYDFSSSNSSSSCTLYTVDFHCAVGLAGQPAEQFAIG